MPPGLKEFYFTIDLRSLGVYRILLAGLLILDWGLRWPDLEVFYTSFGALPVESPLPRSGGDFHFCLLDGVASLPMVRAVFVVGLVCYLFVLAGYHTRTFQILSFVFFTSVLSRAVPIRDGSVMVLATMLLWSLFLPMGKRFSLDALRGRARIDSPARPPAASDNPRAAMANAPGRSSPSLAAFVIVAQVGLIYFFTASAKYGASWRDGTALYYALNEDQIARPFGQWLATQPLNLIKTLTWGTLGLEFMALPLILAPLGQPWARRLAIVSLAGLHLGIALTTTLSFFSITMVFTYALLLGPEDWSLLKAVSSRLAARKPIRSIVGTALRAGAKFSTRYQAAAGLARPESGSAFAATGWWRSMTWAANLAVAVLFATFTLDAYNLNLTGRLGYDRIPEPRWMRALIMVPLIQHNWELFAPDPIKDDGWWVIDGETEAGEKLDPLTGVAPTFEKPPNLAARFDRFWRKYLERLWLKRNRYYRLYFGRYITRKDHRNAPVGHRLARFDFYFVKERTPLPGTPRPWPTERVLLWHHECFPKQTSPAAREESIPEAEPRDSE